MPESAKLTVKVTLHPVPLPAELSQTQPVVTWSVPRLSLALLLLLLLLALSWWGLAEPAQGSRQSTPMATHSAIEPRESQPPTTPAEVALFTTAQHDAVVAKTETAGTGGPTLTDAEPAATHSQTQFPPGFSRIVLTARMERLEPGLPQPSPVLQAKVQRLYLFTELRGYAGQQLRHRWYYQQQLQTEAVLTIEDSPWRTYSEKWLLPQQLGLWRVQILDQAQNVLYQHDFQYQ